MKKRDRRRLRINGLRCIMGDKCKDCGWDELPETLEFHHVIPREISGLRRMRDVVDGNWHDAREEIVNECVLLCARCHKTRHHYMKHGEGK